MLGTSEALLLVVTVVDEKARQIGIDRRVTEVKWRPEPRRIKERAEAIVRSQLSESDRQRCQTVRVPHGLVNGDQWIKVRFARRGRSHDCP